MTFTYVGLVPRHLESGRPLVFGDVIDSLEPTDQERLGEWLADTSTTPAPFEPEPALTEPDSSEVT